MSTPLSSHPALFNLMFSLTVHTHWSLRLQIAIAVGRKGRERERERERERGGEREGGDEH